MKKYMKINAMGFSYGSNIKLGEGLIAIGAASVIAGLVVLRNTSQWVILNKKEDLDEMVDLYKKHM